MQNQTLYSTQESRRLLGGVSRNMIYQLVRTGRLASVVIESRRFSSAEAIADLIERSTTTESTTLTPEYSSCARMGSTSRLDGSYLIPSSSTSVLQMAAISRLTDSVWLLPCASRSRSRVDRYG